MVNKLTYRSSKVNKLEQSKASQTYTLPFDEHREKPSYVLIFLIFTSLLLAFLIVVKQTQAFPLLQSVSSSEFRLINSDDTPKQIEKSKVS